MAMKLPWRGVTEVFFENGREGLIEGDSIDPGNAIGFHKDNFPGMMKKVEKVKKLPIRNVERARGWCFTLNNAGKEEVDRLVKEMEPDPIYAVFGKEVGSGGTPHIQGFIYWENPQFFSKVKELVGERAHIEKLKGPVKKAAQYCKKEGAWIEVSKIGSLYLLL